MSTEPTASQQDEAGNVASNTLTREPVRFPRLQLPSVPAFTAPRTPADELPVQRPMVDQPAGTWQSPFQQPEPTNTYAFQVVPPPPPAHPPVAHPPLATGFPAPQFTAAAVPVTIPAPKHGDPAPTASPTHAAPAAPAPAASAPAPRTTVPPMLPTPATDEAAAGADDAAPASTDVSKVAIVLLLVTALLTAWASRMAFSPALLAMSGLLFAELAIGLANVGPRDGKRTLNATVAAGASVVITLLALKGAFGGFSEMAFVASLFVLVAALPTLLLLGATWFVLRRRANPSPADRALAAGTKVRFGAALALLVSGYLAKDSFSAKPDTFVAFAIVALALLGAISVFRGTGRAARA